MSCSVDFTPACYSRCTIFQSCFTLCWVNSITSPIILLKKVMILHRWIQNAWLSKLSHKKGKKRFNFPRIFSYKLLIIFTLTPFYISSKNILQMTVLLCIQHVCHVRCGHVCMLKKSISFSFKVTNIWISASITGFFCELVKVPHITHQKLLKTHYWSTLLDWVTRSLTVNQHKFTASSSSWFYLNKNIFQDTTSDHQMQRSTRTVAALT